jgi:parallel beta-helix repeat protein
VAFAGNLLLVQSSLLASLMYLWVALSLQPFLEQPSNDATPDTFSTMSTLINKVSPEVPSMGGDIGAKVNATAASCKAVCDIAIPPGLFTFSTPIVLPSNANLYCAGRRSTHLVYIGAANTYAISSSGDRVRIHDCSLTSTLETPSNLSSYNRVLAISLTGTHSSIVNMYVAHFWGYGNMVELGGSLNTLYDSDLEYGTFLVGIPGSSNSVLNNYISNHYSKAQWYEKVATHYWDGINAEGARNSLISGNTVIDNGQSGIYVGGNGTTAFNNRVIGNRVQYNWNRGIDQGVTGDVVVGKNSVQNEIITGNNVSNNLSANIWLACVQQAVVSYNNSSYDGNYAVYFGLQANPKGKAGIALYEECGTKTGADVISFVVVSNNTVVDSTVSQNISFNVSRGRGNIVKGNVINQFDYINPGLDLSRNTYRTSKVNHGK